MVDRPLVTKHHQWHWQWWGHWYEIHTVNVSWIGEASKLAMCVTDPYWHPVSETQEHPQAATRHPSCVNIVYTVITSNKVNSRYSVNCSSSSKVNQQCSQMQTTRRWVLQFDCLELLARQLLSSDLWWQKINKTEFELVNIYCCCLHLVLLSRWIKIDGIIMINILCCSWSWC